MSITDFLLARIADDEEQAEVCRKLGWFPASKYEMTAVSYARVLAECAAKRAIVEAFNPDCPDLDPFVGVSVIATLAAVYADHPDYRAEWKVGA